MEQLKKIENRQASDTESIEDSEDYGTDSIEDSEVSEVEDQDQKNTS